MCSTRIYLRATPLPNYLPLALNETGSYLYTDDTSIFYHDEDVEQIEKVLNKQVSSFCEWFVYNKLWICFGYDETKTIIFSQGKHIPKISVS